jgi:hypothetical protein
VDIGIVIALITSLGTLIGLIVTQYTSRQRAVARIDIIAKQTEQIAELNERLDNEVDKRRQSDARIEALEQIIRDMTVALEKYHAGAGLLVRQLRENDVTPVWEPVGLVWRGKNLLKDD